MQVRIFRILLLPMILFNTNAFCTPGTASMPLFNYFGRDSIDLHAPIKFTSNGIPHFLKFTFNNPLYAQDVLAHDFSHLLQFLQHGQKMNQKRTYCKSVLRMFCNKLKATPFVNAYAFTNLLKDIPEQLNNYFTVFKLHDIDPARAMINEIAMQHFASRVSLFKEDPKAFFDAMSNQILDSLNTTYQLNEDATVDDVRKSLLLMIELGLSKLVWNPQDQIDTWDQCKKIADQLAFLLEKNVINDPDDLNDLFITLIERYCYFLDLSAPDLSVDFYAQIKQNIAIESLVFLEMDEQEQGLETKAERLMRALFEGEAKARGREAGILV